jgi:hypothetical protein
MAFSSTLAEVLAQFQQVFLAINRRDAVSRSRVVRSRMVGVECLALLVLFWRGTMSTRWIAPNAWWLLLPPLALCALDFGLTFHGQSPEYWAGNYAAVNELSPSFHYYFTIHPLVAAAAALLWMMLFSALVLLLPEMLALTLAIAIVIGHMIGATTWLAFGFKSYQACGVLFLLTSALVVCCFKRGQNSDGRAAFDWERTGLPGWMRWVLIAALAVLPTWWFLVPR